MSPLAVRRIVIVVCALGVAGMIVASIAGNNGAALTAGLITAVASLCLLVATAVGATPAPPPDDDAEARAERVEEQVSRLVAAGADEDAVRALVRDAVGLGRARR